ncbi:MAG: TolC family outer membrane protein [Alphaproteobacteria bacterium]
MRTSVIGAAVIAGALGLSVVPAQAETLEEALVAAYRTNPQLEARRAQGRATDEQVPQALATWRPTVSFSGSAGRGLYETNALVPPEQWRSPRTASLTLSQNLYNGGRTVAGTDKAEADVQAERAQLLSIEQTVLSAAATAYLNVVRDQAVLELNISNEQVLQRQYEAAQDRFRVGEITRTDVAQSQARLAKTKAARIQSEGTLETSRATYVRVIGTPPEKVVQPNLTMDLPKSLEEATSLAQASNPTVIAAGRTALSAEHNIEVVRGALRPTVSLDIKGSREFRQSSKTSHTETNEAVLRVSVPIYEQGATYAKLREAKHTAGQRKLEVDDARRKAIEGAATAWDTLVSARAQIKSLQAQIDSAQIALDGVQRESQVGSRTVLDVLNAEQELLDARVSLVKAQRDEATATFDLLVAVGRMNAQGLNLPTERYDPEVNYREVREKWIGGQASADTDAREGELTGRRK